MKTLLEARFHDDCFKKIIQPGDKMEIKAEYAPKIKWFPDSPNDGLICSLCGKKINEEECPIRLWREIKK